MNVKDIKIDMIEHKENIRQKYHENELVTLMQTIKDNGLLQPIGVKETNDDKYVILWGNRRLAACKKLGWKTIPAAIYSPKDEAMTEEEFIVINGIENLQQSPNTLFELGRICKILRKTMSTTEIAARLGIPHARVRNALSELSTIPAKWQKRIKIFEDRSAPKKGDITVTAAMSVSQLRNVDKKTKDKLFEHLHKNETSTAQLNFVASMIQKEKMPVKDAIAKMEKYTTLPVDVFVDKVELETELSKYESKLDFVVDVFNKYNPKLKAIKPSIK